MSESEWVASNPLEGKRDFTVDPWDRSEELVARYFRDVQKALPVPQYPICFLIFLVEGLDGLLEEREGEVESLSVQVGCLQAFITKRLGKETRQ